MSKVQSVVFWEGAEKDGKFTIKRAEKWLKNHKFKPIKPVDKKIKGQLRYRIRDPKQFSRFITKKHATKGHIQFIIGFKTKKRPMRGRRRMRGKRRK